MILEKRFKTVILYSFILLCVVTNIIFILAIKGILHWKGSALSVASSLGLVNMCVFSYNRMIDSKEKRKMFIVLGVLTSAFYLLGIVDLFIDVFANDYIINIIFPVLLIVLIVGIVLPLTCPKVPKQTN